MHILFAVKGVFSKDLESMLLSALLLGGTLDFEVFQHLSEESGTTKKKLYIGGG